MYKYNRELLAYWAGRFNILTNSSELHRDKM